MLRLLRYATLLQRIWLHRAAATAVVTVTARAVATVVAARAIAAVSNQY